MCRGSVPRSHSTSDLLTAYGKDAGAWQARPSLGGVRRTSDSEQCGGAAPVMKRTRSEQGLCGAEAVSAGAGRPSGDSAPAQAPPRLALGARPAGAAAAAGAIGAPPDAPLGPGTPSAAAAAAAGALLLSVVPGGARPGAGFGRAAAAAAAGGGWLASLSAVASERGSSAASLASLGDGSATHPAPPRPAAASHAPAAPGGGEPAAPPAPRPPTPAAGGARAPTERLRAHGAASGAGSPLHAALTGSHLYRAASDMSVDADAYGGGAAGGGSGGADARPQAEAPQACAPLPTAALPSARCEPAPRATPAAPGAAFIGAAVAAAAAAAAFAAPAAAAGTAARGAAAPAAPPNGEGAGDDWDFGRRHRNAAAGFGDGRGGASQSSSFGRRRSSIEQSMPWRLRVDGAIAAAEGGGGGDGHARGVRASASGGALQVACLEASEEGERSDGTGDGAAAAPAGGEARTPAGGASRRGSGDSGGTAAARESLAGSDAGDSAASSTGGGSPTARVGRVRAGGCSGACAAGYYGRPNANGAAFELFTRLNRARQTLDFSRRMAAQFSSLDRAELGVWGALDTLDELYEYEAALAPPGEGLDAGLSLKEHALQTAELCRLAHPELEWFALVGLLHGLGKLLAHPLLGSQPQWAVAGETYPLGCRFAPQVSHAELFSANPDRRRRAFATPTGVYPPGCGLTEVYMSWGAPEYLYLVLALNEQVSLPEDALFLIRHQKFLAVTRPGGAYAPLLSPNDAARLPLLAEFQRLAAYRRAPLPPGALSGRQLEEHYQQLIARYLGCDKLFW